MDAAKKFKICFGGRGKFYIFGSDVYCESKKLIKENIHYHSSWRKQAIKIFSSKLL